MRRIYYSHMRYELTARASSSIYLFHSEVPVELFQGDEAFGEVFVIHLLVEDSHVFLAEQVGTHDVETGTLLCELHTALRAEVLQCDILRENTRNAVVY